MMGTEIKEQHEQEYAKDKGKDTKTRIRTRTGTRSRPHTNEARCGKRATDVDRHGQARSRHG
jgi:hypothetical protein